MPPSWNNRGVEGFSSTPNELKLLIADNLPIADVNSLCRTSSKARDLFTAYMYRRAIVERPKSGTPFFFRAVQNDCLQAVTLFIEFGVDVNMRVSTGDTFCGCKSLGWANRSGIMENDDVSSEYQSGHTAILEAIQDWTNSEQLVRLLIDVQARDYVGFTPFHLAVMYNGVDAAETFLNWSANVSASDRSGRTPPHYIHVAILSTAHIVHGNPLFMAVRCRDSCIVRLLLIHGADPNSVGHRHDSVLHVAALDGSVSIVRLLLDHGADINAIGGGDYGNALQAGAAEGGYEMVRLLLDRGADINILGGRYGNALQAAALSSGVVTVSLLLDRGADVNAKGGLYNNALQAAIVGRLVIPNIDNLAVVRILLSEGADDNARGGEYGTNLCAAAAIGHTRAVDLLLDRGAGVDERGSGGLTPLKVAVTELQEEVVYLLVNHGADVNARAGELGNALCIAASEGLDHMVRILLDHGADVNAGGGEHGTALQVAIHKRYEMVVRLLRNSGATQ